LVRYPLSSTAVHRRREMRIDAVAPCITSTR
jgi:hypothetical protein